MEEQSTKSSLDKTTKQQQNNNEQNIHKNQGENIRNMDDGISLRNNMVLSTTDKDPVKIACPQKKSDNTFTETRKSRRLKKFFPLDIEDFDFNNDIKDDEIENMINNISYKGKKRKIKKENDNSVEIPSFGLNESVKELNKKVKPINNIETFQDENIEMYKGTTKVTQDSRLKTIKQNVFEKPKMKLKTEIDQSITRPSLLEDNFNPKKTVMNESVLSKQHSKTNTDFVKIEKEKYINYMHYKKLFFITSLGLIQINKSETNSKANEDSIKSEPSQHTRKNLKELSIPNEDDTKKAYQTRPVKKKHKTNSNKRGNSQMIHTTILEPEKLIGSAVHPERVCKSHCRMCSIKFGSIDIPHHITEIKNPMTPDFESKCLTNHGVKADSCLCSPCFRIIKRRNYNRIIQQDICLVTTCNSLATETFQSVPMNTIRCNLIEKGIEFKTWTNETSIAICELHFKKILKLTECNLCGSQSQEKCNRTMFPQHIFQRVFDIAEMSIKFDAKSLICEKCNHYLITHMVYHHEHEKKMYVELRSDILISICKYKNLELPEFYFVEDWPWTRVQPEGIPYRQPPTATQMSFILSLSIAIPIKSWRRTLNQLTLNDIRWTIMPEGALRPKWVSWEERLTLAANAGLLPGVPEELGAVEQETSDTSFSDADDATVVQLEETTAQPSDGPPAILDVGGAGQTQTMRRDDVVQPAIPILTENQTIPKTTSTKRVQLPMSTVDDINSKTTEVCEITVDHVDHTENEPASIVPPAELSSSKDIAEVGSTAAAFAPTSGGDDDAADTTLAGVHSDTTLAGIHSDAVTAALAHTTTAAAAAAFVLVNSVPDTQTKADDDGEKRGATDDGGGELVNTDDGGGELFKTDDGDGELVKTDDGGGELVKTDDGGGELAKTDDGGGELFKTDDDGGELAKTDNGGGELFKTDDGGGELVETDDGGGELVKTDDGGGELAKTDDGGGELFKTDDDGGELAKTDNGGGELFKTDDGGGELVETDDGGGELVKTDDGGGELVKTDDGDGELAKTDDGGGELFKTDDDGGELAKTDNGGGELFKTDDDGGELAKTDNGGGELAKTDDDGGELFKTDDDGGELAKTDNGGGELFKTDDGGGELAKTDDGGGELVKTDDDGGELAKTDDGGGELFKTDDGGGELVETDDGGGELVKTDDGGGELAKTDDGGGELFKTDDDGGELAKTDDGDGELFKSDDGGGELAKTDDGGGERATTGTSDRKRAAVDDGDDQSVPPLKLTKFSNGSGQIFTALTDASETDIIYPEHGQPASADGATLRNFVRK